jgi:hypothetical protein
MASFCPFCFEIINQRWTISARYRPRSLIRSRDWATSKHTFAVILDWIRIRALLQWTNLIGVRFQDQVHSKRSAFDRKSVPVVLRSPFEHHAGIHKRLGRTMNLKVFSNRRFFPSILLLLIGLSTSSRAVEAADRPNVLIVVADDLGFSDLGCYGGEIATPNLDGLAKNGLRFTQFYNTARCWPSRAALLTGYYAQQVRRDTIPGIKSGAQGKRPTWAKLLPERLKPLGYRSYHSGKWHIDGQPIRNGFDHSYSLDDHDNHFEPRLQTEDGRALPSVKPGDGYYSSDQVPQRSCRTSRFATVFQLYRLHRSSFSGPGSE